MSEPKKITTPLEDSVIETLRAGDSVLISGVVYAARDAAHRRMVEALEAGGALPFDPAGHMVYYVGPSPAKPGAVIGAAGPTTSGRMDAYTPRMLQAGLKGMIGKGARSAAVVESMLEHRAVYFAAIGGAGALLARAIRQADVIAYEELGAESVRRLVVEDFPAVVVNDVHGGDIYKQGFSAYRTI
jgi:fumarate hydratase subunit beta